MASVAETAAERGAIPDFEKRNCAGIPVDIMAVKVRRLQEGPRKAAVLERYRALRVCAACTVRQSLGFCPTDKRIEKYGTDDRRAELGDTSGSYEGSTGVRERV